MTNGEKYKNEIKKLHPNENKNIDSFGVNTESGEIVNCSDINCIDCIFVGWGKVTRRIEKIVCNTEKKINWLLSEYKKEEKKMLTIAENEFCHLIADLIAVFEAASKNSDSSINYGDIYLSKDTTTDELHLWYKKPEINVKGDFICQTNNFFDVFQTEIYNLKLLTTELKELKFDCIGKGECFSIRELLDFPIVK